LDFSHFSVFTHHDEFAVRGQLLLNAMDVAFDV
jgi:hypothetical protein